MPRPTVVVDGRLTTRHHRALSSPTRAAILDLVRSAAGGLTAAEVAGRTGLHVSTVRDHLDRLTEAGLLVRARASGGGPGRPAWRYLASRPAPGPGGLYRTLAAALLDQLTDGAEPRTAAVRAGQVWGRKLAAATADDAGPADAVVEVLDGLGFAPRRVDGSDDDGPVEIHLTSCPFLELVTTHPDGMCGLHLGIVRGVLAADGVGGDEAVLEPFAAPGACLVRLPAAARLSGGRP